MEVKKPGQSVRIHCCQPSSGGHHIHLIIEEILEPSAPFWDKVSLMSYMDYLVDMRSFSRELRAQALSLLEGVEIPIDLDGQYDMIATIDAWKALYCFGFGRPHYIFEGECHLLHCEFVVRENKSEGEEYYPLNKNFKRYRRL